MLRVARVEPLLEARLDLADALFLADEDRAELRASALFELTPVMFAVDGDGESAVLALPRERSEYGEVEDARGETFFEPLAFEVVFRRLLLDSPADAGEALDAMLLVATLRFPAKEVDADEEEAVF